MLQTDRPAHPVVSRDRQSGRAHLVTDRIYVLFTSTDETLDAARVGHRLASSLGSRLTVVHFRQVGFAAPLEHPSGVSPAQADVFRERLDSLCPGAEIRVCICRNPTAALATFLPEPSLVVVGSHHRPWLTASDRWCRLLEAAGHVVVTADEVRHE